MLQVVEKLVIPFTLLFNLLVSSPIEPKQVPQPQIYEQDRPVVQRRLPPGARNKPVAYVRTELFFGTARPDGAVSEDEVRRFVDEEITPHFPDGLSLLKGQGQFRGENGTLVKEQCFVLVLLYPFDSAKKSGQKIQRIRELYKARFAQESVLRIDDPYIVWVSF
jgi:Protein of unknown function (DUF3574)